VLAIVAQLENTEAPFLHSSASDCDCIVNATLHDFQSSSASININHDDDGFFAIFYRISYIYYSMIGTLLTVLFGLLISYVTDMQANNDYVAAPKMSPTAAADGFRTPVSVGSIFSQAAQRRMDSLIHNVSQTTLKVENILKEVISHGNLHHLHHLHVSSDDEERISILNEEDNRAAEGTSGGKHKRKMFFIGHQDDREHDE
jgi:hypothetical protein